MKNALLCLAALSLLACSDSDEDGTVEDTAEDTTEDTTDTDSEAVSGLLDMTGHWSGECTFADGNFGDNATITLDLESSGVYGDYISPTAANLEGRLLYGTGTIGFTEDGTVYDWESDVDGVSIENAALVFAHDVGNNWGLELDGPASETSFTGVCGAGAWSSSLNDFVYIWGNLSMSRD